MRSLTKSPITLAREAYTLGQSALPEYSSVYSRRDFTQAQLFAALILRQFFKMDYRGIMQLLQEWSDLRETLKLTKVPHWTTLQKAQERLLKKGVSIDSSERSLRTPEAVA